MRLDSRGQGIISMYEFDWPVITGVSEMLLTLGRLQCASRTAP